MQPSIFTRIINGEIPCYKMYEDDLTFAFLDIHPIQEGQVLVISKKEAISVWDLDPKEYDALMRAVRKVGQALQRAYPQALRIGVMIEGLEVPHAHVKVFPFSTTDEYRHAPDGSAEPDHAALRRVQTLITKEL